MYPSGLSQFEGGGGYGQSLGVRAGYQPRYAESSWWCSMEPVVGREIGQLQAGILALSACLVLVRDSKGSKNSQFALDIQVVI